MHTNSLGLVNEIWFRPIDYSRFVPFVNPKLWTFVYLGSKQRNYPTFLPDATTTQSDDRSRLYYFCGLFSSVLFAFQLNCVYCVLCFCRLRPCRSLFLWIKHIQMYAPSHTLFYARTRTNTHTHTETFTSAHSTPFVRIRLMFVHVYSCIRTALPLNTLNRTENKVNEDTLTPQNVLMLPLTNEQTR